MPKLARRMDALAEGDMAAIHADPDLRGWMETGGLVVNGTDPWAERRRYMRERQMGASRRPGGFGSMDERIVVAAKVARRLARMR